MNRKYLKTIFKKMGIYSMEGQKTQGKGVELEDRVMEGIRVRMNKVVCV